MADVRKKLVIVGDAACGKTNLLTAFAYSRFSWEDIQTRFDNYDAEIEVDGEVVQLELMDTSGNFLYDKLRVLCYPCTDVIVMCFNIGHPDSFGNIQDYWFPEMEYNCPNVPILLVGIKKDLRYDPTTVEELRRMKQSPVTTKAGRAMASKMGAQSYLECSALTREGVREVFETATRLAISYKKVVEKRDYRYDPTTVKIRRRRNGKSPPPVTTEDGRAMASRIGARVKDSSAETSLEGRLAMKEKKPKEKECLVS